MYQDIVDKLKEDLPGYHIELTLYPSGGMIDAQGCEECGTKDDSFESARWSIQRHRNATMDDAVKELKTKLGV